MFPSSVLFIPPPQNVGEGAKLDSLCRVGRSVCRPCVSSRSRSQLKVKYLTNKDYTLCHVRSITPLLMEGFPSNLNDTFTSTRGCAEPMLPMCKLKVKVTVKGQIFNKQILHILSCPLYKPYTNGRISLVWQALTIYKCSIVFCVVQISCVWQALTIYKCSIDFSGLPADLKSQGNLIFFQGQGIVREFWKSVSEK